MKLFIPYHLECRDQLRDYCLDYLRENWNFQSEKIFRIDTTQPIVEMLNNELRQKGLPPVITFSIFSRGPGNVQSIHIDTSGQGWTIWKSGIYIPLLGMEGSKLKWFDPTLGEQRQATTQPSVNSTAEPTKRLTVFYKGKAPVIAEQEFALDSTHIINTVIPHRAEASGTAPRAALTIRLQDNPDLISLFSQGESAS
jgi:hypothetical protein